MVTPLDNERERSRRFFISSKNCLLNFLTVGDVGMGKSTSDAVIAETLYLMRFINRKYRMKIFDLYAADRMEGAFRCLPSNFKEYKSSIAKERGYVARGYPTKLLYPMCQAYLKNKIKYIPTIGKAFTIPINSLDTVDFQALIGKNFSVTQLSLWETILEYLKDDTTEVDLENFIHLARLGRLKSKRRGIRAVKQGTDSTVGTLRRGVFGKLIRNGLLSSANCPTALNLKEELKDYRSFSVLILRDIDQDLWGFLVHYFLHHIHKLLAKEKMKPRPYAVYCQIREVEDLLASDFSSDADKVITKDIENFYKQCRTNRTYLLLDLQNMSGTTDTIRKQASIILCHRTSSFPEVQEALGHKRIGPMAFYTAEQQATAPMLGVGECFICRKGKYPFLTSVFPPRHRIWDSKSTESFEDIYKHSGGKFKLISEEIKPHYDENIRAEEYWVSDEGKRWFKIPPKPKIKVEKKQQETEKIEVAPITNENKEEDDFSIE